MRMSIQQIDEAWAGLEQACGFSCADETSPDGINPWVWGGGAPGVRGMRELMQATAREIYRRRRHRRMLELMQEWSERQREGATLGPGSY